MNSVKPDALSIICLRLVSYMYCQQIYVIVYRGTLIRSLNPETIQIKLFLNIVNLKTDFLKQSECAV